MYFHFEHDQIDGSKLSLPMYEKVFLSLAWAKAKLHELDFRGRMQAGK
jgi:hypothetical protein